MTANGKKRFLATLGMTGEDMPLQSESDMGENPAVVIVMAVIQRRTVWLRHLKK
jgi:hypothetical protein